MQTSLQWAGGAAFVAETQSGHKLVIDGPPEGGGRDLGPRPMETLLIGVGACTAYDVVAILKKSRQAPCDCQITLRAERADSIPKVFTAIHIHFRLRGRRLQRKQVERAISLSAEKYCSASIMLAASVKITHSFEIQETDEQDARR